MAAAAAGAGAAAEAGAAAAAGAGGSQIRRVLQSTLPAWRAHGAADQRVQQGQNQAVRSPGHAEPW